MNLFRPGTKRHFICSLLESGLTVAEVETRLIPSVEAQERPWVFLVFKNGQRVPKPMADQLVELRNEISRVAQIRNRKESN